MSIAAPILFGRLHVLPIVTHLLEAHPALRIRLVLSDRNVHLVEDGIDAAIRIGELADSSLIAVKLGEVSQMLAVSPAYLARRDAPAAPAELAGHDLIAFEGITTTSEWRFGGGASVRIEPRFAVNSAEAAIAAAEAGLGITRALSYQVDAALRAGRLVRVLPGFEPPPVPVSALHPASRLVSANIAAFIAAARAYFRATPILPPPCA
jgi:DNA-binding transcriptional LysR family regulator